MKFIKLFFTVLGIVCLVFVVSCSKQEEDEVVIEEQARLEEAIKFAESKGYEIDRNYPNLNADSIYYGMKVIESLQFEMTEEEKLRSRHESTAIIEQEAPPFRAAETRSWQEKIKITGHFSNQVSNSNAEMRVHIYRDGSSTPTKTKLLEAKITSSNPSGATFTPTSGIDDEFDFTN